MTRRAAKVDANQGEVVQALRDMGATVQHLHAVGGGCPDIVAGWRGINLLMEIKDGSKPPSARQLTEDQERWHLGWKGHAVIVHDAEAAINAMYDALQTPPVIPHRERG